MDPASLDFVSRYGAYCSACQEAVLRDEQRAKYKADFSITWERICPERYRDTVPDKLPCLDRSMRAMEWAPGERMGLNLWGYPDTGKTRTMLLVLQNCVARGCKVRLFETGQFAEACEQHAYATGRLVRQLVMADVVAFDDMDKLSLTRHQEMLFFSVVDQRVSRGRPILFTHNSTAAELEYRFRSGESLVRRLRQFHKSIHFPARVRM